MRSDSDQQLVDRPRYYHRDGRPAANMGEVMYLWAGDTKEDFNRLRGVAFTDLGDKGRVSTVFLVMDHAYTGAPLIFETMVFGLGGDEDADEPQWRYSTEAEAKAGHDRIVKALESGADLDV